MYKVQNFYNNSFATLGIHLLLYSGTIVVLFALQVLFNDYALRVVNNILIFVILAISYNLINGVTGQLSLEPNGFVAIGAYITALMLLDKDLKLSMFQLEDPHPFILGLYTELLPHFLLVGWWLLLLLFYCLFLFFA